MTDDLHDENRDGGTEKNEPVSDNQVNETLGEVTSRWFVRRDQQAGDGDGPFTLAQLKDAIAKGNLIREDEIRPENTSAWQRASDEPLVAALFLPDGAAAGPTQSDRDVEQSPAKQPHVAPPPPPSTEQWYVLRNEQAVGPLQMEDLRAQAGKGEVVPDSLVWFPGSTGWQRAGDVAALAISLFRPAVPAVSRLWQRNRPAERAPEVLPAAQLDELRAVVLAKKDDVSEDVSEELALALGLAQRIRTENTQVPDAGKRLRFVLDCLTGDPPRLILARDERLRLQFDIYKQAGSFSRFLAHISSDSPVGLVLVSLLSSLILWVAAVLIVRYLLSWSSIVTGSIFFMDTRAVAVVASASFIGGVVSIATRLREFARLRDIDPTAMFWTAMLKPLIGVVLACFLLAVLAANIVNFGFLGDNAFNLNPTGNLASNVNSAVTTKTMYVLWVLAFLCGFSERFAYDFVDRAQGATSVGSSKPPGPAAKGQG